MARNERALQNNDGLAQTCALNELYGLGFDHSFRTRERLEAITQEQIRQTAANVLRSDAKVISLVLPESGTESALATP